MRGGAGYREEIMSTHGAQRGAHWGAGMEHGGGAQGSRHGAQVRAHSRHGTPRGAHRGATQGSRHGAQVRAHRSGT